MEKFIVAIRATEDIWTHSRSILSSNFLSHKKNHYIRGHVAITHGNQVEIQFMVLGVTIPTALIRPKDVNDRNCG